jgi:DNA-binding MarR family transcriptional regulator
MRKTFFADVIRQADMAVSKLVNPVATHIGYRLRRASVQVMAGAAASIAGLGLHITPATILLLIGANPGCRQSDLCHELGIKRANMTPMIADLAARGWIERAAIDGRSMALHLTASGKAVAQAAADALAANEHRLVAALPADTGPGLMAALARLEASGDQPAPGPQLP